MSRKPQNYQNHAKFVPAFHYVAAPALLVLLLWSGRNLFTQWSVESAMAFLLLVVVALALFLGRIFAMGVQDRVIRLEERLRMERLFDDELKARIPDFTTEQLIGLRFASDAELPELARRVLTEGIADRKTIKLAVKEWRPDYQRV